mmetsp:Transcript_31542/g.44787  ORF Transcript_31542/g.44787 Transcript_31542/m.44787 type:complete len:91 (+) Transcript_31542:116-388(+)|eukprot:CAMPEP_0202478234 /NCGR_PEP_ID=MMETSP1360-20130828/94355_1 /ASSEMBLY_ACC=CAM_ASM_000848 /TAXON_ID=515479 /ORGANISM="Licmophora paradoxa, Strain CCMP2313" /LENGTH=90 /DNA_ID=CAMNT_0049105507 /DNA_START=110 /DNA_END=382 /DNA_ORIENTATION=-
MADVMYGSKLAMQVGCRCFEALRRPQRPKILITDSQRFHGTDFLPNLRAAMKEEIGEWKDIEMEEFTGSGVMVDEDQTYDVKARLWAYGW